jgi:two-component system, LytTR family, sensor kinase
MPASKTVVSGAPAAVPARAVPQFESQNPVRAGRRTLWIWFAGSVLLALATLIWSLTAAPSEPPLGRGPVYPRMPSSPANAIGALRGLGIGALTWYACLLSAPILVWLSRRVPLGRHRRARAAVVHLATLAVLVLATTVAQYMLTYGSAPMRPPLRMFLGVATPMNAVPLLAVVALVQTLESWRLARQSELDAARLGMQLAEARLDSLTSQLQPHFLFNSLQAISTLIHRDPAGADAMLDRLSQFLREVLRRDTRQEVSLGEELAVLESYLDISRQRLGDRLTIDIAVTPEASEGLVPFFLLQPIVENALHHGVAARANGGAIAIRAERSGDQLHVEVTDDGPGLSARDDLPRRRGSGQGIGIRNTRERLRQLYGDACRLELSNRAEGGVRVTIALPFRVSPTPHEPS